MIYDRQGMGLFNKAVCSTRLSIRLRDEEMHLSPDRMVRDEDKKRSRDHEVPVPYYTKTM